MWNRVVKFGVVMSGFLCASFFQCIWVAKDKYERLVKNHKTMMHEWTHLKQELDMMVLYAALITILAATGVCSWWWMCGIVFSYLVQYGISWFLQVLLPPYDKAYKDIPMEKEARYSSAHPDYIYSRWPFMWIIFLFIRVNNDGYIVDKDGNVKE